MTGRGCGATFIGAVVLALGGCSSRGQLAAERFDVAAHLLADRSVEIHEDVVIRFSGQAATAFEQRVRSEQVDALQFVSASIDGRALGVGGAGAGVTVSDGRVLRVRWTFSPTLDATHVFTLTYRAVGGVAVQGARGSLRLPLVPDRRTYSIATSHVVFDIPDTAHLYDGSGIAEAGWSVERRGNGIAASRSGLSADEGATVVAELSIDPSAMAEPAWQLNEDRRTEFVPAFISGGLFILVIGVGVVWIIRFQYPKARARIPREEADSARASKELERVAVRAGLRTAGLVCVAFAALSAAVVWLTLSAFGPWPMALPISIAIVGALFVAVSWWIV